MKSFFERIKKTVAYYKSLSKKSREVQTKKSAKIRPDAAAFLTCPRPVLESEKEDDADCDYVDAVRLVVKTGSASVSMLQRKLKFSYFQAVKIIDKMEKSGIVGPQKGDKPRRILLSNEQLVKQGYIIKDETK